LASLAVQMASRVDQKFASIYFHITANMSNVFFALFIHYRNLKHIPAHVGPRRRIMIAIQADFMLAWLNELSATL